MAIDYIIDKTCSVKEAVGTDGLIDLVKSRNRAIGIYQRLLEEGKGEQEALDTSFFVQTYTAGGEVETKQVTVRDLFQQSDRLKELAPMCKECPLNTKADGFGCYKTVNYPVSAEAERWLAQLAGAAQERGLPNSVLIKFILDEEVQGDIFGRMRKDEQGRFVESNAPIEVLVEKKLLKKTKINTDQLLDMLFAVGKMERTHQMFLIFYSGGVTISNEEPDPALYVGDFQAAAIRNSEGGMGYWSFSLPPAPSDDYCIVQIKEYLRAVFAAFATGVTISVDY